MTNHYPKEFRLVTKQDFSYLRGNSTKKILNPFIFYYKTSKADSGNTRIGLSVSKKVGKANKRNLLKRIVKENFRQSDAKYLNLDVLIVVNPKQISKSSKIDKNMRQNLINSLNSFYAKLKTDLKK